MAIPEKQCVKCNQLKPVISFHKDSYKQDGYTTACRVCKTNSSMDWYRSNRNKAILSAVDRYKNNNGYKDKAKFNSWKCNLKKKFNLSVDDWNKMFNLQNGCCAICNIHQSKLNKRLSVDHNHETNRVRKLLCEKCNLGIGYFLESVEALKNAIKYLEEHDVS